MFCIARPFDRSYFKTVLSADSCSGILHFELITNFRLRLITATDTIWPKKLIMTQTPIRS